MVANNAEQLMYKIKTTTQSSVASRVTTADSAIHVRVVTKAERKINTHDINITVMNKLLVDLDETVTRQSTTIAGLTDKVKHLEQLTRDNSNLESRIEILESLTVERISEKKLKNLF